MGNTSLLYVVDTRFERLLDCVTKFCNRIFQVSGDVRKKTNQTGSCETGPLMPHCFLLYWQG